MTEHQIKIQMDEIRRLVWEGALNIQISVESSMTIKGASLKERTLNLRLPRESYITIYLSTIVDRLRNYLRVDPDGESQYVWLEYQGVPLYWNYPLGLLYDSMTALNPSERQNDCDGTLNVWKLDFAQGTQLPPGVLPFSGDLQSVRSYWMQQWKQACFVLNGSSKQMMSLSIQDTRKFWNSVTLRDQSAFRQIANKVVPPQPRCIPILIHQSLPKMQLFQPIVPPNKSDGSSMKVIDLIENQFPALFEGNNSLSKVVSGGIEVPLASELQDVFNRFMSLDGFLHLSLCLLSDSEYGRTTAK